MEEKGKECDTPNGIQIAENEMGEKVAEPDKPQHVAKKVAKNKVGEKKITWRVIVSVTIPGIALIVVLGLGSAFANFALLDKGRYSSMNELLHCFFSQTMTMNFYTMENRIYM